MLPWFARQRFMVSTVLQNVEITDSSVSTLIVPARTLGCLLLEFSRMKLSFKMGIVLYGPSALETVLFC